MKLSTRSYLLQEVPAISPPTQIVSDRRASKGDKFHVFDLRHFRSDTQLFDIFLLGRRYQDFEVDSLDTPATIQGRYLQPVVRVARQDFIDTKRYSIQINMSKGDASDIIGIASIVVKFSDETKTDSDLLSIGIFVTPGSVCWEDFEGTQSDTEVWTDESTSAIFNELIKRCRSDGHQFGFLTDEYKSAFFDFRNKSNPDDCVSVGVFTCKDWPIRTIMAKIIFVEFETWSWLTDLLKKEKAKEAFQGPLNNLDYTEHMDDDRRVARMVQERHRFADFDMYTTLRDDRAWDDFCKWRVQRAQNLPSLSPGKALVMEKDGFLRLAPLRSSVPLQLQTTDLSPYQRPKNTRVETLLARGGQFDFTIDQVIRQGTYYGQVVLGRFKDTPDIVCVKLFDERMFPIEIDPNKFTTAEDMVRREESVYHRLQHLQGSFIPHSYGMHLFTMPDNWECYGLVMEFIDGPLLSDLLSDSVAGKLPIAEQAELLRRLRTGVGAIANAGIEQNDWHLDQLLCLLRYDSNDRSLAPEVVFIDFGFAELRLGNAKIFDELLTSVAMLKCCLLESSLDPDLVVGNWPGPTAEER